MDYLSFSYAGSAAEALLHINREVIHHGAEIALLRDLYAHWIPGPERNNR